MIIEKSYRQTFISFFMKTFEKYDLIVTDKAIEVIIEVIDEILGSLNYAKESDLVDCENYFCDFVYLENYAVIPSDLDCYFIVKDSLANRIFNYQDSNRHFEPLTMSNYLRTVWYFDIYNEMITFIKNFISENK